MPLLSFDIYPASGTHTSASAHTAAPGSNGSTTLASPHHREGSSDYGEDAVQTKKWVTYVPLGVLLFIVFIPQPSYIITLSSYYLKTRHAPWRFGVHLLAVQMLTLGVLSSLIVCVARDPGSVGRERNASKNGTINKLRTGSRVEARQKKTTRPLERVADTEDGVTTSLLRDGGERCDGDVQDAGHGDAEDGYDAQDEDLAVAEDGSRANPGIDIDTLTLNGRWCMRCRCARPERAHHCGVCGRCVLKMDHHCPWLGGNCVGYRTYPAFVHFLFMATLLAAYISCVSLTVVVSLVSNPFDIDPHVSPLHALFLLLIGAVFTLTMGSFLVYHVFLVSTNQTTLEHMSPFLLLRYIPPPPSLGTPRTRTDSILPYTPYGSRQPQTSPPLIGSGERTSVVRSESPLPLRELQLEPSGNTAITTAVHNSSAALRTTLAYRPPDEHDLSQAQRRVVQHVHGRVRLYDLGWRRNWGEVFGGGWPRRQGDGYGYGVGRERRSGGYSWWRWLGMLVLCGGRPRGDGRTFERGRRAREGLERLVKGLEDVRRSEGRGWRWGGD